MTKYTFKGWLGMKILIVDDSKTDIMMLEQLLSDYELSVAYDGVEAMATLANDLDTDIMILDINMPRMNGFEVLEELRKHPEYKNLATLILTNDDEVENEIRGLELGAVDYIRKPLNIQSIKKRIELHSRLKVTSKKLEQHNFLLEGMVKQRTQECNATRNVTIHAMVGLLEVRNIESSNHSIRTQMMMKVLCDNLKVKERFHNILTDGYIEELCNTTPLHDIGKVGIPDSVLLKPGKLTEDEFEIMKKHTLFGVNALKHAGSECESLSFIRTALEIVGGHHEKFDGTGYPSGLKGKDIPLASRLMAIIDVYDALVNVRVYKPAYTHKEAIDIIVKEKNKHFDPEIVDTFLEVEGEFEKIAKNYLHSDE